MRCDPERSNLKGMLAALTLTLMFLSVLMFFAFAGERPYGDGLTVYMLGQSEEVDTFLRNVSYEAGIDIDVTHGYQGEELTDADARKKLNMELVGGSGPDILIMDDVDITPYIHSGELLDVSDISDSMDLSDAMSDAMRASSGGGKSYCVPIAQTIFTFSWKRRDTPPVDGLGRVLTAAERKKMGFGRTFDNAASIAYRLYLEPSLSGKRTEDERLCKAFFRELKELYRMSETPAGFASLYQGNLEITGMESFTNVASGTSEAAFDYITGIDSLQTLVFFAGEGKLRYEVISGRGGKTAPRCIMAVNRHSAEKEKALKFLRYASSERGQRLAADSLLLPSDLGILQKVIADEDEQIVMTPEYTLRIPRVKDQDAQKFINVLRDSGQVRVCNGALMQGIMREAEAYLNGTKTLEEASRQASEKVWLRMNE